jgi:protein TonB
MTVLRYILSAAAAAAVTLVLFFEMQALIASPGDEVVAGERRHRVEFVRLKKENEEDARKRRLPKPALAPALPSAPDVASTVEAPSLSALLPVVGDGRNAWKMELDLAGAPSAVYPVDGADSAPLARVNPQYPLAALRRGVEGWVLLEFTVTAAGAVTGVVVVDSEPPSVFDRAALRAVRQWRYRPKIVDGAPVQRPGVRVKLSFDLED